MGVYCFFVKGTIQTSNRPCKTPIQPNPLHSAQHTHTYHLCPHTPPSAIPMYLTVSPSAPRIVVLEISPSFIFLQLLPLLQIHQTPVTHASCKLSAQKLHVTPTFAKRHAVRHYLSKAVDEREMRKAAHADGLRARFRYVRAVEIDLSERRAPRRCSQ